MHLFTPLALLWTFRTLGQSSHTTLEVRGGDIRTIRPSDIFSNFPVFTSAEVSVMLYLQVQKCEVSVTNVLSSMSSDISSSQQRPLRGEVLAWHNNTKSKSMTSIVLD